MDPDPSPPAAAAQPASLLLNRIATIHAAMQEEIDPKPTSWRNWVGLLVISLLAFIGTGFLGLHWDLRFLGLLISVLLFHEAGHFLAMRGFGYRDLKMFFIPLLGAAVSGRAGRTSGWQRVVVSLAGPVPSVILGTVLAMIHHGSPLLREFALLLVTLNGLNLLPILPMDGGRVIHQLLCSRIPWVDLLFQASAVLGLCGLYLVFDNLIILLLAIFWACRLPQVWRMARIASELQQEGWQPPIHDGRAGLTLEVSVPVIAKLLASDTRSRSPTLVAIRAIQLIERLSARPVGWLATFGFLLLQVGFLVLALMGTILVLMR